MPNPGNKQSWIARNRNSTAVRYGGAAVAVWVALSLATFAPLLNRHAFGLCLLAVLFTARFLGFGPAIFCSLLSATCIGLVPYHVFSPGALPDVNLERVLVFLTISVFAGSMARQRTLAETRAERSTREMAAIVEYSGDAIFSTDPAGTITSWNRAAEHLFGYTSEEAVGMVGARLAPPEREEETQRNRQIFNEGGNVNPYRTERLRKDGTRVPILLSVSSLHDTRGRIVGASAIARDISAEQQSEEAIRRSEKLATAGRLAASIAHEINNPLEAVVNLLYLAREDSTNAAQYLTMAEQEVGRVARLAQQTLGFVRDTNSLGAVNLGSVIEEMLQLYSRKIEARQIRVNRRFREVEKINGYAGEMRQLFANLIVNAVDATSKQGTLYLRVAPGRDWRAGREGVRVTVADNGSGIAAADLPRIFEPFYTTKKDTGTGLGLWVSSGIVRKHGGLIRVRSRVDGPCRGTVFSVFLPYHRSVSQVE
ncbi:MAG: PAS domain S-box protein [Terriglobales bacterium]|jgi:PAS domain S-box-containing protein